MATWTEMELARERQKGRVAPLSTIQLERVSKAFSNRGAVLPVLAEVDFRAADGEFVGIIGPSGCGKTTLLNIIAGLESPSGGRVLVGGEELPQRLGQMSYMHQKDLLLPWRTVLGNAILGLEVQGVSRRESRRRALKLTERFGLSGFEDHYPLALSGGMRQRAAFLRTVLSGKKVILLDEPFGALDALTRAQMQQWLLDMWDALGNTVVLVTHDVEEVLLLSDRVYVLTARPGRVNMVLPVALPRPRSYEMVTSPSFVTLKAELLSAIRG